MQIGGDKLLGGAIRDADKVDPENVLREDEEVDWDEKERSDNSGSELLRP